MDQVQAPDYSFKDVLWREIRQHRTAAIGMAVAGGGCTLAAVTEQPC